MGESVGFVRSHVVFGVQGFLLLRPQLRAPVDEMRQINADQQKKSDARKPKKQGHDKAWTNVIEATELGSY